MNEIAFAALSSLIIFAIFLFRKRVRAVSTKKIRRNNSKQNSSLEPQNSVPEQEGEESFDFHDQKQNQEKEEFQILGRMGYYLASNDEKGMQVYTATPLQDINPKDLA